MSESGAKSSQPLASKGEKDVSEKRGRGRPRKKPQKAAVTPGRKPRGRPKKSQQDEEEVNISQESSEEEQ
ncbi:high mobility group protein HMG-I/HMG-Y isoform X2 [Amazona aestiva]|uniref:High mobility group protein HMG-I/HMG-Y n=1 Tax=Amazona aestiva TaxID=12930 RepID=A0A0Q3WS88_AMAAE|nr:high mobility group protein HMG-I/HMG-Y isoform X2 [Amazona aestiva]